MCVNFSSKSVVYPAVVQVNNGQVKTYMEIFGFLQEAYSLCINHVNNITFDKTHPRHFHLISLYGSIIELTSSIIVLIEVNNTTGVPSIFRTILEAHVDFRNLYQNAEYGYSIRASYHKQWEKILKKAQGGSNLYLQHISELEDLDQIIQEHRQELQKLEEKGYKPLNVYERFKRAEMEDEYFSLYNMLSNDAHNNIRALMNRHLDIEEDEFIITYFRKKSSGELIAYLDTTAAIIVETSIKIHDFFQTGSSEKFLILDQKLVELRKNYSSFTYNPPI